VTMMSSVNENQPITMALVPTPLLTTPFPKSWAMTDAATDAVCCQRTETRTKMEAMKMMARAICETGREGNGLTSRSDPSESSSSCHPGKVARRSRQMKAKMMAIMLTVHVSKVIRQACICVLENVRILTSGMGTQSYP
jgi:hypothetical protein